MSVFAVAAAACVVGAVLAFVLADDLFDVALGALLGVLALPLGVAGAWRSRSGGGRTLGLVGGILGLIVAAGLAVLLVVIVRALAQSD